MTVDTGSLEMITTDYNCYMLMFLLFLDSWSLPLAFADFAKTDTHRVVYLKIDK